MSKFVTKCFIIDLSRKTDRKLAIIFGHLTYSASKLWNKRPRYQPKNGHFPVIWKEQGFRVIGKKLRLSLSKQTKQY
ncbi:MAG: transposase, partial [Thermoproteota archaeon]